MSQTFFAGIVVHITKFFAAAEVQRAIGYTLTALPISQVRVSKPLAFGNTPLVRRPDAILRHCCDLNMSLLRKEE